VRRRACDEGIGTNSDHLLSMKEQIRVAGKPSEEKSYGLKRICNQISLDDKPS